MTGKYPSYITSHEFIITFIYRDARDIQERHYQAKRFKAGIKLKDAKRVRSRRQSNDSYLAERNIPR